MLHFDWLLALSGDSIRYLRNSSVHSTRTRRNARFPRHVRAGEKLEDRWLLGDAFGNSILVAGMGFAAGNEAPVATELLIAGRGALQRPITDQVSDSLQENLSEFHRASFDESEIDKLVDSFTEIQSATSASAWQVPQTSRSENDSLFAAESLGRSSRNIGPVFGSELSSALMVSGSASRQDQLDVPTSLIGARNPIAAANQGQRALCGVLESWEDSRPGF